MEFENKVAFVTGAASGIGLGISKAFAAAGMKVMMADLEKESLERAVADLRAANGVVEGIVCDVTDLEAVQAAAKATIDTFEKVHVVVNNAGVGGGGETGDIPMETWRWVVDVNLMGVVHGCETFVPLIKEHGEGGFIVNTASMAGVVGVPGMGPYNATKFAVVGYSESMRAELEPQGIGVAALCPGWVKTQIHKSTRNHPVEELRGQEKGEMLDHINEVIESGMSPDTLGKWVLENIENNAAYIFTHPNWKPVVGFKAAVLDAAFDAAAASSTVTSDKGAMSDLGTITPPEDAD